MANHSGKYITDWQREHTDVLTFRVRKEEQLPQRLQQAVDAGKARSRQAYMLDAIRARLDADGIEKPAAPDE